MKYSINFNTKFKKINEVDEVIINYNLQKLDAINYLINNRNQCVVFALSTCTDNDIKVFNNLIQEHPEADFKIRFEYNTEIVDKLKDIKFKYYFNYNIKDWDTLHGILSLNVSDVMITEDLGFELDKIAEIVHKSDVQIRCYANIAQSSWAATPALKKFFIRPEDIDIYEKYIDIIEFFGESDKIETYYDIYKYDKKWFGKLNEIIYDFDSELDSRYIIPRFAEARVKCGKKCLKGNKCATCENIAHLSESLEKAGMIVKKEENKNG